MSFLLSPFQLCPISSEHVCLCRLVVADSYTAGIYTFSM